MHFKRGKILQLSSHVELKLEGIIGKNVQIGIVCEMITKRSW